MLKSQVLSSCSEPDWEDRVLELPGELESSLGELIPGARLELYGLAGGVLRAALIEEKVGRTPLPGELVEAVMDCPPFWSLLWPSGELLCRVVSASPELIRGRTFLDFGAGSGLLAAAAALAGARASAYDTDAQSLLCCALQAQLNGVSVEVTSSWEPGQHQTTAFCDVFYDEDQLPLLESALAGGGELLVADTRLRDSPHPEARFLGRRLGEAVPDLDPHREFGTVSLWYCGPRFELWQAALERVEHRVSSRDRS